jgi:hypothetical protein
MEATLRSHPLPTRKGKDILRWGKKGDKNFRVKEAYMVGHGDLENAKMSSLEQSLGLKSMAQNSHLFMDGG